MKTLNEYVDEYRRQIQKGDIKLAYRGLMEYILELKTHFAKKYPRYNDLDSLTRQIESGTLKFIDDVTAFLEQ
jgi:hypothetical protein